MISTLRGWGAKTRSASRARTPLANLLLVSDPHIFPWGRWLRVHDITGNRVSYMTVHSVPQGHDIICRSPASNTKLLQRPRPLGTLGGNGHSTNRARRSSCQHPYPRGAPQLTGRGVVDK